MGSVTTTPGADWEYAPAPESREIVTIQREYGLFIGGEFVPPASGEHFTTLNPASEEPLARVAQAGPADVDRAVASAREASEASWGRLPGRERAKYLYRIARAIQERAREFAVLESLDNGKPIKESRDVDVPLAAAHFFYHAGWADKLDYAGFGPDPRPLGVAGQVIPWNFPLLMAAWKLAPALATGNTCVLKPAETTPLTALLLAEVIAEAGLPPGTVNVITGDGRTDFVYVRPDGSGEQILTLLQQPGGQLVQRSWQFPGGFLAPWGRSVARSWKVSGVEITQKALPPCTTRSTNGTHPGPGPRRRWGSARWQGGRGRPAR